MRNRNLILNYIFISCLAILFLNDHFFKFQYTSWFTGKLSDVVGIILLPMLLTYLFPKLKQYSVFVAGFLFAFWKSPYSENLIQLYNTVSPIPLHRVVDYTDLLVLLLLPVPYILIKNTRIIDHFAFKKINPSFVLLPSMLILMSTSNGSRYFSYVPYSGNLHFNNNTSFEINKSKNEVLLELKKRDIRVEKDTARIIAMNRGRFFGMGKFEQKNLYNNEKFYHVSDDSIKAVAFKMIEESNEYKINTLQLGDQTIWDVQFNMYSKDNNTTKVIVNSARIGEALKAEEVDRKLRKIYKKLLIEKFNTL
ncbi:hypothetical protein SAMN05421594_0836 [Chryseobacterium oleae]|uniref:Uncharacterized protein n=1 Tax=Chryseobacterium oleae TaxID=491207 RepID=A0A1I4W2C1_CHROL|nr:hypothetical protein [Chryseobacterium oleae]SFN07605.1 hypothetical protein SAMN05421594_0836 [Chryseobacterium oleae]